LQAQGEFAQVKDKLEAALALAGQPVKRGTMAHKHIVYMMLTEAAARLEDLAALARYLPLLEELALHDDHQPYLAIAHRARGVAHRIEGQFGAAQEQLMQSLSAFEELQLAWQAGRTRLELGALSMAQGDEPGARAQYERALAAFKSLGAEPEVEHTQSALTLLATTPSA
jgi:hypothetical protein